MSRAPGSLPFFQLNKSNFFSKIFATDWTAWNVSNFLIRRSKITHSRNFAVSHVVSLKIMTVPWHMYFYLFPILLNELPYFAALWKGIIMKRSGNLETSFWFSLKSRRFDWNTEISQIKAELDFWCKSTIKVILMDFEFL